jgi:hypothetical protein
MIRASEFAQIMGGMGSLAARSNEPLAADRKPCKIHKSRKNMTQQTNESPRILTSGSGSGTLFGLQLKSSIDSTWFTCGPASPAATTLILLRCSASESLLPLPDSPLFASATALAGEPPSAATCAVDPSLPGPRSAAGDRFTIHGNGAPLGDGGLLLGCVAAKAAVLPSGGSGGGCLTRMYAPWGGGGGGRDEKGEGMEEEGEGGREG